MRAFLTVWFLLSACAALALAAGGCVPGGQSARPVVLQRGSKQVEIEVVQDGRTVIPADGVWRLGPRPFEFRLSGDLGLASYQATAGEALARKLAALDRPLAFFASSIAPADGNRLYVLQGQAEADEAAELFAADEPFFTRQWGAKEPQARELAARLRKEFGTTPAIACFGHCPFPSRAEKDNPRYFLANFSPTDAGRSRGEYRVDSISDGKRDQPLGRLPRVHLLLFIESPIDKEFRRVSWTHLVLEFAAEAPARK